MVGDALSCGVHLVWKLESTFPFLNHFRVMFQGKQAWDSQVKLTVRPGAALITGPDTTGGEGLTTKSIYRQET
jgi:hypothetical protein